MVSSLFFLTLNKNPSFTHKSPWHGAILVRKAGDTGLLGKLIGISLTLGQDTQGESRVTLKKGDPLQFYFIYYRVSVCVRERGTYTVSVHMCHE